MAADGTTEYGSMLSPKPAQQHTQLTHLKIPHRQTLRRNRHSDLRHHRRPTLPRHHRPLQPQLKQTTPPSTPS